MSEVTLILCDKLTQTVRKIHNPVFIPRVGEHVKWDYEPYPTVLSIIYDYDEHIVYAVLTH